MPPRFDWSLNVGTLLTILLVIISVTAAWIANRERTLDNQARIISLSAEVDSLEVRLRALEFATRPDGYPR